jgi:hypothetical protein
MRESLVALMSYLALKRSAGGRQGGGQAMWAKNMGIKPAQYMNTTIIRSRSPTNDTLGALGLQKVFT